MKDETNESTMSEQADAALVGALLAGDKAAFGELVERHRLSVERLILRMVGQSDLAVELTQEATVQAYLSLATLQDPARFGPWWRGIARNVCRTYLRGQRVTWLSLDAVEEMEWPQAQPRADAALDPALQLDAQEERALIHAALATLSPKNGAAAWLFYMEAMSIEEIAATLAASPSAIKGRLFQARKHLHATLAPLFAPTFGAPQLRSAPSSSSMLQRKETMANISTVKIYKISPTGNCILYLLDTEYDRYLSLWIGAHEGEQIQLQLEGKPTTRPMTYRYFADFLQAMEIQLEGVSVARLHESTFYAVTQFRNGELRKELDARPSDAIGLALHTGSPIYVEEALMTQTGKALPAGVGVEEWFASELERIQEEQLILVNWQAELFETGGAHFTQRARVALQKAVALAQFVGHNYVGTEHLLWGLTKDSDDMAAQLLYKAGVTTVELNQAAIARFGPPQQNILGAKGSDLPPPQIVPRVSAVLELANAAREESNAQHIGTEHLLLGILREGGGMAVTLLQDLNVDLTALEQDLLTVMFQ